MLDICSLGGKGGGEEEVEYVYIIHEVNCHVWSSSKKFCRF